MRNFTIPTVPLIKGDSHINVNEDDVPRYIEEGYKVASEVQEELGAAPKSESEGLEAEQPETNIAEVSKPTRGRPKK